MFKLTEIENEYIPISVKKMSISKTKFNLFHSQHCYHGWCSTTAAERENKT